MKRVFIFLTLIFICTTELMAENEIKRDTLFDGGVEVIIELPPLYKKYKFGDGHCISYAYLLKDLEILEVTFLFHPWQTPEEGDSIIWDVKVGNIARSFCVVRDQKYIRRDIYVGRCFVGYSNATEKNLPYLNSILDNIIVRRREE